MYDHYTKIDKNGPYREEYTYQWFKKTAAHEFGHAFGLGDAYDVGWHKEALETEEVPSNDMMRANGEVTANDIEMLLLAWKLNTSQEFVDSSNYKKSSAISSY